MNTLFVLSYNFYVRARVTPCSFLCRELFGYILYGNPFACIRSGFVLWFYRKKDDLLFIQFLL